MATSRYRSLGQVSPTTTSTTVLCAAATTGRDRIISTITLANIAATPIKVDLHWRIDGAAVSNGSYLVKGLLIDTGQSELLSLGLTLADTDVLSVACDTANGLAANVSGTEITYP